MASGLTLSKRGLTYLVVVRNSEADYAYVSDCYAHATSHAGHLRLISPLISIDSGANSISQPVHQGALHFFFTTNPQAKLALVAQLGEHSELSLFLTHGNAEVVAFHPAWKPIRLIRQISKNLEISVETWELKKCRVARILPAIPSAKKPTEYLDFSKIEKLVPSSNGYLEREFHSLMVRRNDGRRVSLRHAGHSAQHYIDQLESLLKSANTNHAKLSEMWKFAGAHTYNVGQRFSGLSPILHFTCPTGGFEVLGVGKALRAIESLGQFVFTRLTNSGLYNKLCLLALNKKTALLELPIPKHLNKDDAEMLAHQVLLLREKSRVDRIEQDMAIELQKLSDEKSASDKMVPLLHYFSARDGFQFDGVSISVPLQVMSCANTVQWSLMSLTHEYCHVISGGIIAIIKHYWATTPEALRQLCSSVEQELNRVGATPPKITASSVLDFVSKALLSARVPGKPVNDALIGELSSSRFKREDEIMTLIFDLEYFYRGDVEKLIKTYWSYWLGLPGLHVDRNQIVTYIVRSCCALAANYLNSPIGSFAKSIKPEDLLKILRNIIEDPPTFKKDAIDLIIGHINDESNSQRIYQEVLDYLPLICSTLGILVFTDLSEGLWKGRDDKSRAKMETSRRDLRIDYEALRSSFNPLELIATSSDGVTPNEHDSAWILTMLDILSDGNV